MPVNTASWSPVARIAYEQKNNSPITYRYSTFERLRFEMELRAAIVAAAEAMSRSGLRFANFDRAQCNGEFWILTPAGGFQLRNGVAPADAIRDIFVNGPMYATECATATVIVAYKGILDSIRPADFNRLFSGLLLYDWHTQDNLLPAREAAPEEKYIGDLLYFNNPEFNPATPEWRGENVVKMYGDFYYGHPFGVAPYRTIIDGLNRGRMEGSTTSAYLTNEVVFPNSNFLSRFALDAPPAIFARIGGRRYAL
nr:protein-glutamine gamma-glutamyltransferase [Cohnella zeiphila]